MVILIVDDVHFVVTEVLLIFFLELDFSALKHNDIAVFFLFDHLFLNFFLSYLLLKVFVKSSFAKVVLQ